VFDRIVLRRSVNGPAITAGELAEALFFYQHVHIVFDYPCLLGFAEAIGLRTFLAVLSRPDVTATYIDNMIGTNTERTPSGEIHSLAAFNFSGTKDSGPVKSRKKRLQVGLARLGYDKKEVRRFFERFRRLVKIKKATDDYFIEGGLVAAARQDLLDHEYVDAAARIVAQELLRRETLPSDFYFKVYPHDDKFTISTNIDFEEITKMRRATDPNAGGATPAQVAQTILSASVGTIYAGHYGGDFYTSTVESRIIRIRHQYLLRRAGLDLSQVRSFNKVALDNFPTIAEVINSGDRTFDEFLAFLKKSKKFKDWLRGRSPDEDLMAAYIESATAKSWLENLPAKSVRYLLGTAINAVDELTGHAFSVSDAFFLDKLFAGWRANQFVTKQLRDFLTIDEG